MNSLGQKEFKQTFLKYLDEHKRLSFEYTKIPNWRMIKQYRNLKERDTLTRLFLAKTRKWDM